jgi:hypothetical protein
MKCSFDSIPEIIEKREVVNSKVRGSPTYDW